MQSNMCQRSTPRYHCTAPFFSCTTILFDITHHLYYTAVLREPVCLFMWQDAPSYVEKRLVKLLEAGVVSALVCMVKQESPALTEACRECIAR